ncbi:MAG TPA: hypothetical protein PKH44_16700, partial [Plasticicumulans sp.]|nr:hypothetical protein [Plasticicumulans sp.]
MKIFVPYLSPIPGGRRIGQQAARTRPPLTELPPPRIRTMNILLRSHADRRLPALTLAAALGLT